MGCSPSESLVAWGGGGFRVMLAGLDLGVGSGLDSSGFAGTVGWMSGLAAGKSYRYSRDCDLTEQNNVNE